MKRNRIHTYIKVIILVVFLSGCKAYQSVNISNVDSVNFAGMVNNKVSLELKIPIENPNWYKIKVKSMDMDVKVNGNYLGKLKNAREIVIPAKSDTIQVFPVDIYVKNLFGSMSTLYKLRKSKSMDMEIEGTMKVKALLSSKTIEISEKQRVSL